MDKSETGQAARRRLLVLIGCLYMSQGIPMGLAFVAYPAILRTLDYSTEAIGLLGLVALPWALKFLWAPMVDNAAGGRLGKRRSWIVPAQALAAALYFAIAALPEGGRTDALVVVAILLAINIVSATQDIATDGLAVDHLRGAEVAHANGLQIGAFSLGMMIGGSLTVILYDSGGWAIAFSVLGGLILASLAMALAVREPLADRAAAGLQPVRARLWNTVRRPGALVMIATASLFYFAHAMVGAMSGPFFVDAGLSLTQIGILSGFALTVAAGLGALVGSFCAARFGALRTAIVTGSIAAASLALWLVPAQRMEIEFSTALAISGFVGVFTFASYSAFFTIFMQWASPEQAGTDFTVLQCSETCFGIVAGALAGQIAGAVGFAGLFGAAALVGCAAIAAIGVVLARRGRARSAVSALQNSTH